MHLKLLEHHDRRQIMVYTLYAHRRDKTYIHNDWMYTYIVQLIGVLGNGIQLMLVDHYLGK
jgi:hypothetical protein